MSRLFLALVFLAMPALASSGAWAGSYDIPAFPGEPAAVTHSGSCLDTPIERLAADPRAAAVIDRNIPGLLSNEHYPVFKTMSLRTVAALSSGRITKGTLMNINHQLAAEK